MSLPSNTLANVQELCWVHIRNVHEIHWKDPLTTQILGRTQLTCDTPQGNEL